MVHSSYLTPHKLDVVLSGSLLSLMAGFLTSEVKDCSILRDMPTGMLLLMNVMSYILKNRGATDMACISMLIQ